MSNVLVDIRQLTAGFRSQGRTLGIVRGVDLTIVRGEVLGIIGESGSGKTVTGLALLRLLPDNAEVRAERMLFDGCDLLALDDAGFDALRGARLAMIFQDPVASFNPAKRIGWHLRIIFARADKAKGRTVAEPWRERARAILLDVGIMRAEETIDLFPHQLSGGMLQRVLIALILALEPDLIVADEPTTNLDKLVERQILRLFRDLQRRLSAAIVFITHDMATAASLCDRIAVMYAGQIVEIGRTRDVFEAPRHPYTQGLVRTSLALARGEGGRLAEIAGELPNPSQLPPGCLFEPRCDKAFGRCRIERPEPFPRPHGRAVRCFLAEMEREPS